MQRRRQETARFDGWRADDLVIDDGQEGGDAFCHETVDLHRKERTGKLRQDMEHNVSRVLRYCILGSVDICQNDQ